MYRKKKKMYKSSLIVTSFMLIPTLMPVTAMAEETQPKNVSNYSVAYKSTDSVKDILVKEFGDKANGLVYSNTKKEKDGTVVIEYKSDDYQADVENLNLDSVGSQTVKMKMSKTGTKLESKEEKQGALVKNPIQIGQEETEMDSDTENSALNSGVVTTKESYITVTDSQAPTIEGPDVLETEQGKEIDIKSNYTVKDDKDTDLGIGLDGSLDFGKVGDYPMTIVTKDSSGNESTKKITVKVKAKAEQPQAQQASSAPASSPAPTVSGQASSKSEAIANAALSQLGVTQDCTMLVTNSLRAVGINFHGWPYQYAQLGSWTNTPVPGDIIIYSGHVAIYVGNGQAVHGGWMGYTTVKTSVACDKPLVGYIHVN